MKISALFAGKNALHANLYLAKGNGCNTCSPNVCEYCSCVFPKGEICEDSFCMQEREKKEQEEREKNSVY
jgi:hypothetical protein